MVKINNGSIEITFKYDADLVEKAKSIAGHKFNPKDKSWTYPLTQWNIQEVYNTFKESLTFSDQFLKLTNGFTPTASIKSPLPLFPFQQKAVQFLYHRQGRGLVCDEVGLGKTVEALAYLGMVRPKRTLILTNTSILYHWQDEIKQWLKKEAEVYYTSKQDIPEGIQYLVTTYNLLGLSLPKFLKWNPDCIVLDEFHHIKNYKAKRTKCVQAVARKCSKVIGLSGTPLLNKPQELYNMLNLLDPHAWGFSFLQRYCHNPQTGYYDGARNLKELQHRLNDYMISRTKREVMKELPPLSLSTYTLDADVRYIDKINRRDAPTLARFGYTPDEVNEPIHMMQLTLMGLEEIKIQKLRGLIDDMLYNLPNKKVVLYVSYLRSIEYVTEELSDYGVSVIQGSVSAKDRQAIIKDWQNNKSPDANRVMVITSAGSEGINLFGKNGIDCSTLIFVGRQWSPEYESQIIGRVDRMGQEYPVNILYLTTTHWADEKLNALLRMKGDIIEDTTGKQNKLNYLKNFEEVK